MKVSDIHHEDTENFRYTLDILLMYKVMHSHGYPIPDIIDIPNHFAMDDSLMVFDEVINQITENIPISDTGIDSDALEAIENGGLYTFLTLSFDFLPSFKKYITRNNLGLLTELNVLLSNIEDCADAGVAGQNIWSSFGDPYEDHAEEEDTKTIPDHFLLFMSEMGPPVYYKMLDELIEAIHKLIEFYEHYMPKELR